MGRRTLVDIDIYINYADRRPNPRLTTRILNLGVAADRLDVRSLLLHRILSRNARFTRNYALDSDFADYLPDARPASALTAPYTDRSMNYLNAFVVAQDFECADELLSIDALRLINAAARGEASASPRPGQNWIAVGCKVLPDDAAAYPPPPEALPQLLSNLRKFGNMADIRAAQLAFAYYLEVHPFIDGNGRTARILLSRMAGGFASPWLPTLLDEQYFAMERLIYEPLRERDGIESLIGFADAMDLLFENSLFAIEELMEITAQTWRLGLAARPPSFSSSEWETILFACITSEIVDPTHLAAIGLIREDQGAEVIETLVSTKAFDYCEPIFDAKLGYFVERI